MPSKVLLAALHLTIVIDAASAWPMLQDHRRSYHVHCLDQYGRIFEAQESKLPDHYHALSQRCAVRFASKVLGARDARKSSLFPITF